MARFLAPLIAAVVALALASGAGANTLSQSIAVQNTDVKYAGFSGMRDVGTGTLTVSGVSGPVTGAYLYWHGPTNTASSGSNSSVLFNGSALAGNNIGTSDFNCWAGPPHNFVNSQAYFANVTSRVSGNGNYSLANFVKSGGDVNVNGVSLIVFHDDGNDANDRNVSVLHGNDSNVPSSFDAAGWAANMTGINYVGGTATLDLHVSDGQDDGSSSFHDDAVVVNGVPVAATGPIFNGDSVPGHDGSGTSGRLWDIKSFSISSRLSPGLNSVAVGSDFSGNDCLSLIAAIANTPSHPPSDGAVLGTGAQSPSPVARRTVVVTEVSGSVRVKVPGSGKYVPIGEAQSIPAGSLIDARKGRVRLTSAADGKGKTQSAVFYDGIFRVTYATEALASGKRKKVKRKVLITQLALVGRVGPCPKAKKAGTSAKRRKRRLWGKGKGRFRTRGKRSSALVRGTTWLVQDSCAGTLTKVTSGSVTVRDFRARKTVIVKKGQRYLAR